MRTGVLLVLFFVPSAVSAQTVADARTRWLKGNYDEAREAFLLRLNSEDRVPAAIGLSRVEEDTGNPDAARSVIDKALSSGASPDLWARKAELLYRMGDRASARSAIGEALKGNDSQFLARWIRSRILLDEGKLDEADAECRWFVRTYVERNRAGRDIKNPDELLLVARAGSDNARWHRLTDQFKFILNEVIGDALKADKDFWPAEAFAGRLLLEKYNKVESLAAFDKALVINPRSAEALAGKGRLALEQFDLKEADSLADRALEINPLLPEVSLLKADVAWAAGDRVGAGKYLQPLESTGDEEVLARLSVSLGQPGLLPTNPRPARFHYRRGKWFDDQRQYDAARKEYEKAIEFASDLTPARTELGLLVLRLADEDEAKKLLTEAMKADPFHVRLSNSLKVLKHLEKYQTIRTPHFIVRFEPTRDGPLGRLVAEYLEADYEKLAQQFQHRPAGPFVVEVFNSHEMFSGRVIAGPDLHTVGATTGRVLAMAGPRAAGVKQPYNWARVLRHELTHIFNLDQSNYLVSHWLTEGLAVNREGFRRPADWLGILAEAGARGELFAISELDRGFTLPRSPAEWTLAYAQSQLAVDYVTRAFGPDTPVRLLREYAQGASNREAMERVCGKSMNEIEKAYAQFVLDDIRRSGAKPMVKSLSLNRIESALEKIPDDPELNAAAAEQFLRRKRVREAREHANAALAKNPANGTALRVIAQLYLEAGDEANCLETLNKATSGQTPDLNCLRSLVQLHLHAGRAEEALATAERGAGLDRNNPAWLNEVARAARQAGDFAKSAKAMDEYLKSESDDLDGRRDLAKLLFEMGKYSGAEKAAREAIEIDPGDDIAAELLINSLLRQSKSDEANKWRALLGPREIIRQERPVDAGSDKPPEPR
ncbi:MAG: tetratricopeptide repeat protein [Gemmataceae bacterium]|nr:tetratricopeptide repeat protein [Gemmataceae bacterium]